MTATALMRRAALLILAQWVLLGVGFVCVSVPTPDAWRDTVHARHTGCLRRLEAEEHAHGVNGMAWFQCARDEDADCKAHGLEPRCGEWQAP